MKKVTLFHQKFCPYCVNARRWVKEVLEECPELCNVEIEMVDENANFNRASKCDYYYVPTFYVGSRKIHEGAASKQTVEKVLREAAADIQEDSGPAV